MKDDKSTTVSVSKHRPASARGLKAAISALRATLASGLGTVDGQKAILELIGDFTGSTFSAFNLNDELGRVIGGIAHPFDEHRARTVAALAPTLNALLMASPVHEFLWHRGASRICSFPTTLLRSLRAYELVYSKVGIDFLTVFDLPSRADRSHVVVGIGRSDRDFNSSELKAFEAICNAFLSEIDTVESSGPLLPDACSVADHRIVINADNTITSISLYAEALLTLFYGPIERSAHGQQLPQSFLKDVVRYRGEHLRDVIPTRDGVLYAFTKAHRGRSLCVTVCDEPNAPVSIMLQEDVSRYALLRTLKRLCASMKRDGFQALTICLLMLEGVRDDRDLLRRASMIHLSKDSARKLLAKARQVLRDAERQAEASTV